MASDLTIKGYTTEDISREAFCQAYSKDGFFGTSDGAERACESANLPVRTAVVYMMEPQTLARIKEIRRMRLDTLPDDILQVAKQFKTWADNDEFPIRERRECLTQYAKLLKMYEEQGASTVTNQQINNYNLGNFDPSKLAERVLKGESIDDVVHQALGGEPLSPKILQKHLNNRSKWQRKKQRDAQKEKSQEDIDIDEGEDIVDADIVDVEPAPTVQVTAKAMGKAKKRKKYKRRVTKKVTSGELSKLFKQKLKQKDAPPNEEDLGL